MFGGIEITLGILCPHCNLRNPVPGFFDTYDCFNCGHTIPIREMQEENYDGGTRYHFGGYYDIISEALVLREEGEKGHCDAGHYYGFNYRKKFPGCPSCKKPFENAVLTQAAGNFLTCSHCSHQVPLRMSDEKLRKLDPRILFTLGESPGGPPTPEATHPVVMPCMSCGGSLKVDGTTRLVRCSFCSNDNYLPDALWLKLHPVPGAQSFTLVYGAGPMEMAEAQARFCFAGEDSAGSHYPEPDDEKFINKLKKGLREQIKTLAAPENLEKFLVVLRRKSNTGLLGLALEEDLLPAAFKTELAKTGRTKVCHLLANSKYLEPEIADLLASHPDAGIRTRIAGRKISEAQMKKLASDGEKAVRLVIARRVNLTAEIFQLLSRDTESEVRKAIAANAKCPPEILKVMRFDAHDEVAATARNNKNYRPGFFKRLFGG